MGRMSRSYLILFYPIYFGKILYFPVFGKCAILSYFLAILPLILVFYSLFITIISCKEHSLKFFSLTLLGIKIFYVHIMLESIFWPFSLLGMLLSRRKWIIFLRQILFLSYFLKENPIFGLFFGVTMSYFPIFFDMSYYLTP